VIEIDTSSQQALRPKVFISYSWTDPPHEQRVIALAMRLVSDGIDVVLDKWDLQVGQDKYRFMEQMVNDPTVDKVLMFSDSVYSAKADGRAGGVGTETQIISQEVYNSVTQTKFIPIIAQRDAEGNAYLPTYLKSRIYVDMSSPAREAEKYEELIRLIYGKPQFQKPTLGSPPAYILEEGRVVARSSSKVYSLRTAMENDRPVRIQIGLLQDTLQIIHEEIGTLQLQDDGIPLDEQVVQAIDRFTPYRDDFVGVADLTASLGTDTKLFSEFTNFFEKQLPHVYSRYESREKDHHRFVIYEFFLYYVAVLMQRGRFAELDVLLSYYFIFLETDYDQPRTFDFSRFGNYLYTLDRDRKERLNSRRISITTDLFNERATLNQVSFNSLMEADLLLFLRYAYVSCDLENRTKVRIKPWYPRTLIYASQRANLPFYYRMRRKRDFDEFKQILRVESAEDITQENRLAIINGFSANMNRAHWLSDNRIEIAELACLNELGILG